MRSRLHPRGQGATELALGVLVFITILMFGIHFAEMGRISLKVQEAGAYAVWEATGRKVQNLETGSTGSFSNTLGGAGSVQQKAANAYSDFNGLTGTSGSSTIKQALTKAYGLDADCQRRGGGFGFAPSGTASAVYQDVGGLECRAWAKVEAFRIPSHFLDDSDGLFQTQHERAGVITFCSIGQSSGSGGESACNGWLPVLTNDWGLMGDNEADSCVTEGGGACDYSNLVQRMFASPGSAGLAFAQRFAGTPGTNESVYNFAYRGVEDAYTNTVGGEGQPSFNTGGPGGPWPGTMGGGGVIAGSTGHNCFLGMHERWMGCP